jgi:hypothetical protein
MDVVSDINMGLNFAQFELRTIKYPVRAPMSDCPTYAPLQSGE